MATIIRRGGKWQAQICVNGVRKAKTFKFKNEAKEWANKAELETQRPELVGGKITLYELLQRFDIQRGADIIAHFSFRVREYPLGQMEIRKIRHSDIEAFIQARLGQIKPGTARRVVSSWSPAFNWAVKQGWIESNPCQGAWSWIPNPQARERVPSEDEYKALCEAAGWCDGKIPKSTRELVVAAFRLAMWTGMRGGEILKIEPEWIRGNVLHLPAEATKSRRARDVALSSKARELIASVLSLGNRPHIWGINDQQKTEVFIRLRRKAGLGEVKDSSGAVVREALHFHDSRAYFCTWAGQKNEKGETRLTPLELARQLGHSDLKMVMRYFRSSAEDIAARLE